MLELGPIGFLTPWVLCGLAALPLIYRLLRVTPPKPQTQAFPPVRLLARLTGREQTPARTPWWMLLLRMVLAALLIVAGAGPVSAPETAHDAGGGPALLIIDNGWPSAPHWAEITAEAGRILDLAGRRGRGAAVILTAEDLNKTPPVLTSARAAKKHLQGAAPRPWAGDRRAAARGARRLTGGLETGAEVFWLTDGVSGGGETALAEALAGTGARAYAPEKQLFAFADVASAREGLNITLARPEPSGAARTEIRAYAADGAVIARADADFAESARLAETSLNVPAGLRNRIERLEAGADGHAAAAALLDERWRRRTVGLTARGRAAGKPLTGELYYLSRALAPSAGIIQGPAETLARPEVSVIAAADPDVFAPETEARLLAWVRAGGVFVSFAGPRMAARAGREGERLSALIPFPLRPGGRAFGGAMTWAQTARLGPFDADSPFAGLTPPEDAEVRRQVLAEPSIEAEAGVWARLEDGTPLVTARALGEGHLALFHVTANAEWSDLPLSGLFVNMLERITGLAAGTAAPPPGAHLAPVVTVDGFGRAGAPAPGAAPVSAAEAGVWTAGPAHPPGLYAAEGAARALNLRADPETFRAPDWSALDLSPAAYGGAGERGLRGPLLMLAAALFLLDLLLSLMHRGFFARRPAHAAAGALLAAAGAIGAMGAGAAQADDAPALPAADLEASLAPRIAWVKTGDARTDALAEAGMRGLTVIVRRRTAAELGAPRAVDPARDSLALYPLIYWPLADGQEIPGPEAARNVRRFLDTGGMILFDTRDDGGLGAGPGALRTAARALDLPPLIPAPADHVLSRSFYLLRAFPGRWGGGRVWTGALDGAAHDGTAGVIAGGADWAAAWAMDDNFRPLAPVTPGGERQRETAFRFGVNLVMYALTGNYKEDQVHIPEILRRLGQ